MPSPATIKIFLVNGQPDGLRTAEISNWSGLAVAGPRSDLGSLRSRAELQSPGIYLLIGEDEDTGFKKIYIGEAENVAKRLAGKSHTNREFWVSAITFVSKDSNLTKAHIKFLEGRLIERANELGIPTDNEQSSGSSLPESDQADMEQFLERVYQLLPILGLTVFDTPEIIPPDAEDWLFCTIKGLTAKGRRTPSGFLVTAGSQSVKQHRPSAKRWSRKREALVSDGVLVDRGEYYEFSKDIEFSSPSAAGAAVRGGAANGLTAWRDKYGVKLKELEEI